MAPRYLDPVARPAPLLAGTLLMDRFEIEAVLGQGAFGITYQAGDRLRKDRCVVRELAPADSERIEEGNLRLSRAGEAAAQRLRQAFSQEARRISRLTGSGLPLIRASFVERGTAFLVREHLPNAMTLAERLVREGRQSPEVVEYLLVQLAETLARIHANGLLHLDLRPSNILIAESGLPHLIDFGEARRWRRELFRSEDALEGHPPEMALRGSRTGPETDVYLLASSLYQALTGSIPAGPAHVPLTQLRPEAPPWMEEALSRALRADPGERPRTVHDLVRFRESMPIPDAKAVLDGYVSKKSTLQSLKFDRRQCPACHGVLEEPRPLKLKVCPVCHEGTVRPRKVIARLCPHCRAGILKHLPNLEPLAICPACALGRLERRRRAMFAKEYLHVCAECSYAFDWQPPLLVCVSGEDHIGDALTCEAWRQRCHRSAEISACPGCEAQFDLIPDGRWRQAVPAKTGRFDTLEPDEWDRVAAGLPPEAGNAECDACGADFHVEGELAALLETRFDPHGFAAANTGRLLSFEELRWIGVGKESPHPGLACSECHTEFDHADGKFRLVRTPNAGMLEFSSTPMTLENWHRAAADLPLIGQETAFEDAFGSALREAYVEGAVPFSARDPELIWKGSASRMEAAEGGWKRVGEGQFVVDRGGIRFGGMFKKAVVPFSEIVEVTSDGVRADFKLADGDTVTYDVQDVEWTAQLESGPTNLRLNVFDLVAKVRHEMRALSETAASDTMQA